MTPAATGADGASTLIRVREAEPHDRAEGCDSVVRGVASFIPHPSRTACQVPHPKYHYGAAMQLRRRLIWWLGLSLVLGLVIVVVSLGVVVPALIQGRITDQSRQAGWTDTAVGKVELGWGLASIGGITLATAAVAAADDGARGGLELGTITAGWTLAGIRAGRVGTVVVHDGHLRLLMRQGMPELSGVLPTPTAGEDMPGTSWTGLPFDRLVLEAGRVELLEGMRILPLLVDAELNVLPHDRLLTRIRVDGIGRLSWDGAIMPTRSNPSIDGRVRIAGLDLVVLAPWLQLWLLPRISESLRGIGGLVEVDARVLSDGERRSARGTITWRDPLVERADLRVAGGHWLVDGLVEQVRQPWSIRGTVDGRESRVTWRSSAMPTTVALLVDQLHGDFDHGARIEATMTLMEPWTIPQIHWRWRCDEALDLVRSLSASAASPATTATRPADLPDQEFQLRIPGIDLAQVAAVVRQWPLVASVLVDRSLTVAGIADLTARATLRRGTWAGEVTVELAGAQVQLPTVHAVISAGRIQWQGELVEGRPRGCARLEFDRASVALRNPTGSGDAAWLSAAITGTIPWVIGDGGHGLSGSVTIADLTCGGHGLPPLLGEIGIQDQRIHWRAAGVSPIGPALRGSGSVDLSVPAAEGVVSLLAGPLEPIDRWRWLVPAIEGWSVTGEVRGEVAWSWSRSLLQLNGHGWVEGVDLTSPQGVRIAGVTGPLSLRTIAPLVVELPVPLTASRAEVGALRFTDLRAAGLLTDRRLRIDALEAAWCGATLRTTGTIDDLAHPVTDLLVRVEHLDLGQVLDTLAGGRCSGSGRLSGQVPITLAFPGPQVRFGAGSLLADPAGGWFTFAKRSDVEWLLANVDVMSGLRDAMIDRLPAAAYRQLEAELRERLTATIGDFAFTRLQASFIPRPTGSTILALETAGAGRTTAPPLPVGALRVNIHQIEEMLRYAIRSGSMLPTTRPEADPLDDFFR